MILNWLGVHEPISDCDPAEMAASCGPDVHLLTKRLRRIIRRNSAYFVLANLRLIEQLLRDCMVSLKFCRKKKKKSISPTSKTVLLLATTMRQF